MRQSIKWAELQGNCGKPGGLGVEIETLAAARWRRKCRAGDLRPGKLSGDRKVPVRRNCGCSPCLRAFFGGRGRPGGQQIARRDRALGNLADSAAIAILGASFPSAILAPICRAIVASWPVSGAFCGQFSRVAARDRR